ncbi:MAG: leucine-rich repeat protein [Clostridia bacterium]|nr:leucine-rich repeat protein [Clostridia bacterium]
MTNTKNTKHALLSSILALFLCFSMLLGTTWAWFTDSVTSAGNIIQSGTLDVEMEWKDATATGAQQTYKDASEGAIFNYDKWEPGYVEAKNIKISNVGTLALQYNLHIAANGEVSKLADVIDVYYAEGEYTLATREMTELTKIGTLTDVLAGMPANMTGDLEAGKNDLVTIALKMQEDAGNDYQGLSIGTNFSVILMATQDNVEKDAFDENYDDIEIPEMHIENINGVTYGIGVDGNYYMISVDDYTLTSFTVDENVTVLGTGDGVNDNDRVFGKNAPLTSLTLPEGLTEIKDNALNALPNLTTVNIPSTVETIGIQSFRQTGMSEITVPANVETVKLGAFRDMANLTTVTVEGNVAFDNYAFRSCPNLTSIYLLGDDVTFTGSQFATHSDNGDATGITIYVKNATVAARVYAAQTSAYGYEVKVLGDAADGSDAGDVAQATSNTQLSDAITNGAATVLLGSGEYTMPASAKNQTITIAGNGSTTVKVVDSGASEGDIDYSLEGANVTFENVTINMQGTNYPGYARIASATYNNCTFTGANYCLYGDSVFNNCTFNITNGYVWTWGAANVEFNNCTFEAADGSAKAILVHNTVETTVKVKDCTFIATTAKTTWDGIPVAAVSIDPENGSPDATVYFEGTNTYSDAFHGLYQVKYSDETDDVKVYVNNTLVENVPVGENDK